MDRETLTHQGWSTDTKKTFLVKQLPLKSQENSRGTVSRIDFFSFPLSLVGFHLCPEKDKGYLKAFACREKGPSMVSSFPPPAADMPL